MTDDGEREEVLKQALASATNANALQALDIVRLTKDSEARHAANLELALKLGNANAENKQLLADLMKARQINEHILATINNLYHAVRNEERE